MRAATAPAGLLWHRPLRLLRLAAPRVDQPDDGQAQGLDHKYDHAHEYESRDDGIFIQGDGEGIIVIGLGDQFPVALGDDIGDLAGQAGGQRRQFLGEALIALHDVGDGLGLLFEGLVVALLVLGDQGGDGTAVQAVGDVLITLQIVLDLAQMGIQSLLILIDEIWDLDPQQQCGAGDQDHRIAIEGAHGGCRRERMILGSGYVYIASNAIVGGTGPAPAEPGHDFERIPVLLKCPNILSVPDHGIQNTADRSDPAAPL